jgi:hypothetical protein
LHSSPSLILQSLIPFFRHHHCFILNGMLTHRTAR